MSEERAKGKRAGARAGLRRAGARLGISSRPAISSEAAVAGAAHSGTRTSGAGRSERRSAARDLAGRRLPDLGIGIGLRTTHFSHILSRWPKVDWFEIVSENFMDTGGRPLHVLDQVAERYPIVMHGVSMSIGSTDPLDLRYLDELKRLRDRCHARFVSDHLCWTGVAGTNVHDLLPMPYTEEALAHVVARVKRVQEHIAAPIALENPSSYLEFADSSLGEAEFLARVAQEADCFLLLDVNNVYVSSVNHGFDPVAYIDAIPPERVAYFHLAGHTDKETHLLDTHSRPVIKPVWDLYRHACARTGDRSTLLEWDEDIPPFRRVHAEAKKASRFRG